jgi:hypothetical protein
MTTQLPRYKYMEEEHQICTINTGRYYAPEGQIISFMIKSVDTEYNSDTGYFEHSFVVWYRDYSRHLSGVIAVTDCSLTGAWQSVDTRDCVVVLDSNSTWSPEHVQLRARRESYFENVEDIQAVNAWEAHHCPPSLKESEANACKGGSWK